MASAPGRASEERSIIARRSRPRAICLRSAFHNRRRQPMIARRIAIASLVAATGAFAVSGCGMMGNRDKGAGGVMNVPLSAQNEVPPNSSTGSGTARVELDGNVLKWNVTYSGTTGPVTAGHFHGPAQPGANAGVVVPFAGPLDEPDRRLGDADADAGRPGQARPVVRQPAHRRAPGRRAARPGEVSRLARHDEAPPVTTTAAPSPFPPRAGAARCRCTLPVVVIGSASMNSISFGYS